jgi:alkylhydroperoxidase family enzyme
LAKRHGWSEDQVANLADFRNRDDFTEAEKLALTLAELETLRPDDVDDELWAALKQHYSDGEIIELAAAIGLFNYFNRFNDVLKMEPTK